VAPIDRFVRHVWLVPAIALLAQVACVGLAFGLRYVGAGRAAQHAGRAFESAFVAGIVLGPLVLILLLVLRRSGRMAANQPGVARAMTWAGVGTIQLGFLLVWVLVYRYF